eukprot:m.99751 g.99751  ORF g.99751 m.99751 type:complete len:910 (+) comp14914_c0_seq1:535-3264(+)
MTTCSTMNERRPSKHVTNSEALAATLFRACPAAPAALRMSDTVMKWLLEVANARDSVILMKKRKGVMTTITVHNPPKLSQRPVPHQRLPPRNRKMRMILLRFANPRLPQQRAQVVDSLTSWLIPLPSRMMTLLPTSTLAILPQRKPMTLAHLQHLQTRILLILPAHQQQQQQQHHTLPSGGSYLMTEESELSDASPSAIARGKKVCAYQIRIQAVHCAQTIALLCPRKVLFRYWLSFFPEALEEAGTNVHIIITHDLIPKVRQAALQFTQTLLDYCRSFLMTAEQTGKSFAFTSYAATLSGSLHLLHMTLAKRCVEEHVPSVITASFKCLTTLMSSTPYHRFKTDYVPHLLPPISTGLLSRDQQIQILALKTFAVLFTSSVPDKHLNSILGSESADGQQSSLPAVLPTILALAQPERPVALRVEALQALTAVVCRRLGGISSLWPLLQEILMQLMSETTTAGATSSATDSSDALALIAPRMLKLVEEASRFLQECSPLGESAVAFWEAFTESALQACLDSRTPFIRSCACDCLASIGNRVYSHLKKWKQRHYLALLLGLCHDEAPPVKAAACRALGSMVAYPYLQEDALFMADMAVALTEATKDDNITVRVRASWALGNYCNALGTLQAKGTPILANVVPLEQLRQLLQLALGLCEDKDKIRANALRAIGELGRILTVADGEFFIKCIGAIVTNTQRRPPKVQWNACHAARHLLQNHKVMEICAADVDTLVATMLSIVRQSTNYKVRIGAASALRSLDRNNYHPPEAFKSSMQTLLDALSTAEPPRDFNEHQYRQTLHKEVSQTLGRMFLSASDEDMINCAATFETHHEEISQMLALLRREYMLEMGSMDPEAEEGFLPHHQAHADVDDDDEADASIATSTPPIDYQMLETRMSKYIDIAPHRPLSRDN